MTEENIYIYKLFLSLICQILVFYVKSAPPPPKKKVISPLFLSNPPSPPNPPLWDSKIYLIFKDNKSLQILHDELELTFPFQIYVKVYLKFNGIWVLNILPPKILLFFSSKFSIFYNYSPMFLKLFAHAGRSEWHFCSV